MRSNFESLLTYKTKRLATMLAILLFVVLFNCFPAIELGFYHRRYKFVGTANGKVRGHLADDGDYLAFLGIPYAAPPVGENRFKAPVPPFPWQGILDATRTVKCPQKGEGDEDCLVINVFTPLRFSNTPLPVLVYIHGGSYLIGSGPIKGMYPLVQQNIIVVTFNYRLGALGFLCLGIKEAPGNAGLKDQVAALKWVKKNIYFFGGDPDHITVYGMSAGGASVEYLLISEMSKGLVQKAIIESASATSVWALNADPIGTAKQVGELLEFPATRFMEILVEYYKDVRADILSETNYQYYNNLSDGTFGFVPCVERQLNDQEPFLESDPVRVLERGRHEKVPIIFFFAALEGLYLRSVEYYENKYKERMETNLADFMPADLIFKKDKFRYEAVRNVKRLYFGNSTNFSAFECLQYFGDCLVLHGILHSVEAHSSTCNLVFLMEFAYKGYLGGHDDHHESIHLAGHGDVVKYAMPDSPPVGVRDTITVRRISTLIANFVKHGNPTPTVTSLLPIEWPSVKPGNITYLYLDWEFKVGSNPYEERISLWDKLYARFRRHVDPVLPNTL